MKQLYSPLPEKRNHDVLFYRIRRSKPEPPKRKRKGKKSNCAPNNTINLSLRIRQKRWERKPRHPSCRNEKKGKGKEGEMRHYDDMR